MDEALRALERGAVVAAATESLFGLLADATRPDAVDRLWTLKPRGADRGVPLLLPDRRAWSGLVREMPPLAERLADAFWPGPLSIALQAAPQVDPRLTRAGRIAVRLPGPSVAAELVRAFGQPLTATSANRSGEPPPTTAGQVAAAFAGAAAESLCILRPAAPGGAPSTVVAVDAAGYRILRPGRIAPTDLVRATGLDPEQGQR